MIDIYKYINSVTVEKYLRKIKYKFSTIEALWIVYQSRKLNLLEQQKLYREIMKEYPNCEYHKENYHVKDVFKEVKKYIDKQNKDIKEFAKCNKDEYYSFLRYYDDLDVDRSYIFTSYNSLISFLKKSMNKSKRGTRECEEPDEYSVGKHKIGNSDFYGNITFNKKVEVVDISPKNERMNIFMEFYLKFPIPFKKGDIVCFAGDKEMTPYVYDEVCYENCKVKEEYLDSFDMCVNCYSIEENGSVDCDHYSNYMNLEFYSGKIKPQYKCLKAISSYLRGKIRLDELLNINKEG